MKTLHLNVHRKWFDMIKSGEKKEEYREITEYWKNRLLETKYWAKGFDTVTFSNGYAKNRDQITVQFEGLKMGEGKPEWGAEKGKIYFIIHLGDVI